MLIYERKHFGFFVLSSFLVMYCFMLPSQVFWKMGLNSMARITARVAIRSLFEFMQLFSELDNKFGEKLDKLVDEAHRKGLY
jgi:hypothetical protein